MRNALPIGISSRSALWSQYAADQMFAWLCHDGSGKALAEVNGAADAGDYSGTDTNLWSELSWGVKAAGDGGWLLPAAVNAVFDLSVECRVVVSAWVTIDDEAMSSQDCIICAGPDNGTEVNAPGVGHFRFELASGAASIVTQRFVYRNASAHASAPSVQTVAFSNAIGAASNTRHHLAVILHSTGATVDYRYYDNAVLIASGELTANGTGPMKLDATAGQVAIGAKTVSAGSIRSTGELGENTSSKLEALLLWRKRGATELDAIALVQELHRYRAEAPARA